MAPAGAATAALEAWAGGLPVAAEGPMPLRIPLWPPGRLTEAGEDAPCLEAYLVPSPEAPRAAMVVCPGGGYGHLAAHEAGPVAVWLNGVGISAFVLRYRIAPHRHPAPLEDAQRALRLVRHRATAWDLDPGRLGMLGFSAGGHLTATAGTYWDRGRSADPDPVERQGCRPDLMVLCYPVISLTRLAHEGTRRNLLGAQPAPDDCAALSLETQVTAQTPPAFVWHTADDVAVSVEHSLGFAAALCRGGVPFELHVYESGRHGLGLAGGDRDVGSWTVRCATWLAKRGFGTGTATVRPRPR